MSDPEVEVIRRILSENPAPQSLAELRKFVDLDAERYPLSGYSTERISISGLQAEWAISAGADQRRAILYLHGGGYAFGSILSHRHLAAEIGRSSGCKSLILDYRRAPEHPYPAAVEDAMAAYSYLLEQGMRPEHIAVVGDSAGGGLAAATLLSIKSKRLPQPACGWLISPWVDMEATGRSYETRAQADPMVKREMILELARMYLAGHDPKGELVSPIYANLTGIAPLLLQVGAAEVLLDDSLALARQAGSHDVAVQLEIWPDMIHIWHTFFPILSAARRAIANGAAFVKARMDIQ
ncbi:alpha/beta hydrolase [Bradyrhizobium sp. WYCCWR 13022]|uniref:alpha/beta hydrolase n=1 Tax=unclassified Bradyrhizobium TaxID=2631580 RepID=UPI00263AB895|nr:alpha/beta hydrolase [Bradyrhizobium sp. WYCCWR 13022]MDN4984318.1 alpha/beta hydrolase [Bradyrhizobium sp. WYCCWR 13022]